MLRLPHDFIKSGSSYSAQVNMLILRSTLPPPPVPWVSVPPVVAAVPPAAVPPAAVPPLLPPDELLSLSLPHAASHRAIALAPPAARKRRRLMFAARRSAVARGRRMRGASSRSMCRSLLVAGLGRVKGQTGA